MTIDVVGFGLAGACIAIELTRLGATVRVSDNGLPGSTSVAAGLINPVAGKNFQPSWRLEEFWVEAHRFYQDLDPSLYHATPIFRRWMDDRDKFEKKKALMGPWLDEITDEGVLWKGGGWLETRRFLEVARAWLLKRGVVFQKGPPGTDFKIDCTGSSGLRAGNFRGVEHRCAKGEILTVKIPDWQEDRILTGGGWIIPIGDGVYRAGATYDWDGLDSGPTEEGQAWVERLLKSFTNRDYEILDHVAGVRPIVRRSQPVIHFQEGLGWMFNGLGSKGVIYAPGVARRLAEHLISNQALDPSLEIKLT